MRAAVLLRAFRASALTNVSPWTLSQFAVKQLEPSALPCVCVGILDFFKFMAVVRSEFL